MSVSFAPVSILFFGSRPTTIFRRIRTVIIDTVNTFTWWPWSHVCKEVFERIKPTIANGNSASTVFVVAGMIWVVAAALHSAPNPIFTGATNSLFFFSMSGLAVGSFIFNVLFSAIASARNGQTCSEATSTDPFGCSASAKTSPGKFPSSTIGYAGADHSESTVLSARHIDWRPHKKTIAYHPEG